MSELPLEINESKVCTTCMIKKPIDQFNRRKWASGKPGRDARCRECSAKYCKDQYHKNRPARLEQAKVVRNTRKSDPVLSAKDKEYAKAYRNRHPERMKSMNQRKMLKMRHNLTPEILEEITKAQGWKCACCGCRITTGRGRSGRVIDHCHVTGAFRAIICRSCNCAEGHIQTPDKALKLYRYMLKNELLSYQPQKN